MGSKSSRTAGGRADCPGLSGFQGISRGRRANSTPGLIGAILPAAAHAVMAVAIILSGAVDAGGQEQGGQVLSVAPSTWSVPLGGNTFRTAPGPEGHGVRRNGTLRWSDPAEQYSVYFHVDRPCQLDLQLSCSIEQGGAMVRVMHGGECLAEPESTEGELQMLRAGSLQVAEAGYVRIDLQGARRSGPDFGSFQDLVITSPTEGLDVCCVRNNEGNMFYWGRRGPSVHLTYEVPRDRNWTWAYSELTVPEGEDPVGSYFMANGFAEGYFGMQVNSETERRILFSVWSPFATDDPRSIPEDQRIVLLARGPDVHAGEFGNEGSGGQSYLVYPWRAGETHQFLTGVVPDGKGQTTYTSWFRPAHGEWMLIASFRRPATDTHLRGFHSFLESFSPETGMTGRRCQYGNVWVGDRDGNWMECRRARFSVDATGGQRHRLDFAGGAEGDGFWLRNCGFFSPNVPPGEVFERQSSRDRRPAIDFSQLPR